MPIKVNANGEMVYTMSDAVEYLRSTHGIQLTSPRSLFYYTDMTQTPYEPRLCTEMLPDKRGTLVATQSELDRWANARKVYMETHKRGPKPK